MKKKTPTQVLSCEFCGIFNRIFKITCCEEHLRTAASIRCFFDTIYLRQSSFCTTYSYKILISERKCENNLKNCESKKKILKYSNRQRLCNVLLRNPMVVPCFTKILKMKISVFWICTTQFMLREYWTCH